MTPTYNKTDMMDCARGFHSADEAGETCTVCGEDVSGETLRGDTRESAGGTLSMLNRAVADVALCATVTRPRTVDDKIAEAVALCKTLSAMTGMSLHTEDGCEINPDLIVEAITRLMHLSRVEDFDFPKLVTTATEAFDADLADDACEGES